MLVFVYLLCAAATIWFLLLVGDHLMPTGSTFGGRHDPLDATAEQLARWTGVMLTLFGIAAVWLMILDLLDVRRKARLGQDVASQDPPHTLRNSRRSTRRRTE